LRRVIKSAVDEYRIPLWSKEAPDSFYQKALELVETNQSLEMRNQRLPARINLSEQMTSLANKVLYLTLMK
jgi:hypothetical protein